MGRSAHSQQLTQISTSLRYKRTGCKKTAAEDIQPKNLFITHRKPCPSYWTFFSDLVNKTCDILLYILHITMYSTRCKWGFCFCIVIISLSTGSRCLCRCIRHCLRDQIKYASQVSCFHSYVDHQCLGIKTLFVSSVLFNTFLFFKSPENQ